MRGHATPTLIAADRLSSPPQRSELPEASVGHKAQPIAAMIAGYHTARPSERAAFGMLSSCAVSIGAARTINYSRERRRRFPWLRGWARRIYHAPGRERIRVHHFIPGIALAFVSGAGSILKREDGLEFWLGIAFGTGVGLTLDEAAVLTELDNPYWESQRFALANAAVAALGAGFLGHRFYRHQIGRLPSDRST